ARDEAQPCAAARRRAGLLVERRRRDQIRPLHATPRARARITEPRGRPAALRSTDAPIAPQVRAAPLPDTNPVWSSIGAIEPKLGTAPLPEANPVCSSAGTLSRRSPRWRCRATNPVRPNVGAIEPPVCTAARAGPNPARRYFH